MQILLAQIQCTSREFANRRSSNATFSSLVVCFSNLGWLLKNDAILLGLTPSLLIPRDSLCFDALPEGIGHILLFVERLLSSEVLHAEVQSLESVLAGRRELRGRVEEV